MNNPDWKYKGFFMRYQEIHLNEEFYEKLKCPRTAITEWDPVSLIVESKLSQVGNTSCEYFVFYRCHSNDRFVIEFLVVIQQDLRVENEIIGESKMQICCIDFVKRGLTKLPESLLQAPEIIELRKVPRPVFPRTVLDPKSDLIGECCRNVQMSDTDENDHLNEAGYLRYCTDAYHSITKTKNKNLRLKSIKALYKKELRCDDTVTIKLNQNDENSYVCSIFKNEALCFEAEITFY